MFLPESPAGSGKTAAAALGWPSPSARSLAAARIGSEYAGLCRRAEGPWLLRRRPGYYARKIAVTMAF